MLRSRLLTELLSDIRSDRKDISEGQFNLGVVHCFKYAVAGFRIFEGELYWVILRFSCGCRDFDADIEEDADGCDDVDADADVEVVGGVGIFAGAFPLPDDA